MREDMPDEYLKNMTRRNVLKTTTGAAVAFGNIPAVGATRSSDQPFKSKIKASHRLLENGATHEERESFLEKHGVTFAKNRYVYQIPAHDDGMGTMSYEENDLDITIYLWHNCPDGQYYAELIWTYLWEWYDSGSRPNDRVGIGYNNEWWDYESYSISTTTETSTYVTPNEDEFGEGPAFEVDDYQLGLDSAESDQHWAGVYLEPVGNYTSDERRIQGGYAHLWEGVTIESVSVGYPWGISVSVSDTNYKWETATEIDGDTLLRVAQEDSIYCS